MLQSFLGHLLVEHGILGLVDAESVAYLFHVTFGTFLTDVKGDLGYVLDFSLDEFLMVRWSRQQRWIDTLYNSHKVLRIMHSQRHKKGRRQMSLNKIGQEFLDSRFDHFDRGINDKLRKRSPYP